MKIQSETYQIPFHIEKVIFFLSQPSNLEKILPSDRISEFRSTGDSCFFKVQSGIPISFVLQSIEKEKVIYKSGNGAPFPFFLTINLEAIGEETKGYILFEGDAPPFIASLAERPLSSLFNHMSSALAEALNKS